MSVFDEGDVLRAINKLKSNFTCGPDGLFKCLKHVITLPLTLIYKQMLSISFVPTLWKKAIIYTSSQKGACLYL